MLAFEPMPANRERFMELLASRPDVYNRCFDRRHHMPIPDEVETKIREQEGEVSGLKCLAERAGQFSYVVYKEETEASVCVYCFNSLTESIRKLVCPWKTAKNFQQNSFMLHLRFDRLMRLDNNTASNLMFDLIIMADSIQSTTFEPFRTTLPIPTQRLSRMDRLGISLTLSRVLTRADSAEFLYERRGGKEWITQYSYRSSDVYNHGYLQWEITSDGMLGISMIRNFQKSSDVEYDNDGYTYTVDNRNEIRETLMEYLRHHENDDNISEADTDSNLESHCKLPSKPKTGRPFQSLTHYLLQLDGKLKRYCKT